MIMKTLGAIFSTIVIFISCSTHVWSEKVIHPISNPVYADTAFPKNSVNVVFAHHTLPDKIETIAGELALGGDINVLAVQIEWALNEAFSFVANKDGYIDINPDSVLNEDEGLGDLSAGIKWLFHNEGDLAIALRGTVEFSTGDEEVFQGNGDANFSPAIIVTLSPEGSYQLNGVVGFTLPFDSSEESTMSYVNLGWAYRISEALAGMLEFTWFRVINEGDGDANFDGQLGSVVPSIITFEGPDIFNLGSLNADENPDYVTLAIGGSYEVNDNVSAGLTYEIPLTDSESSLTDSRWNLNITFGF